MGIEFLDSVDNHILQLMNFEVTPTSNGDFNVVYDGQKLLDMVNHPPHYVADPSGIECIEITRHRNFNIGNAIKYLWRQGLKDEVGKDKKEKQIEDLKKAIWYIEDEIKRIRELP